MRLILYQTPPLSDCFCTNKLLYQTASVQDSFYIRLILYLTACISDWFCTWQLVYQTDSVPDSFYIRLPLYQFKLLYQTEAVPDSFYIRLHKHSDRDKKQWLSKILQWMKERRAWIMGTVLYGTICARIKKICLFGEKEKKLCVKQKT